jgi:hypothetical protein
LTKACICFFGFLRTYDIAMKSYDTITKYLDTDVFVFAPTVRNENSSELAPASIINDIFGEKLIKYAQFCYETSFFKSFIKKYNLPERVSLGERDGCILKSCCDKNIRIPDYSHYITCNNCGKTTFGNWNGETYKAFSMFYQIKKVLELKDRYEQENNFKYDVVFLTRPDTYLTVGVNINFDLNRVYFDGCHIAPAHRTNPQCWADDHILMSNSDNISCLGKIFDKIHEYHNEDILINNETLIYFHLKKNNIEIKQADFTQHFLLK